MKRPLSRLRDPEPPVRAGLVPRITVLGVLALAALTERAPAGETPSRLMRPVRRVHVHRVWSAAGTESDTHSGMSIYAHVEAVGLKWQSLLVEVRLRTPDGTPVRVAGGAPKHYADDQGQFLMSTRAPVFDDPFEWPELRASVPYEKVLDLPGEPPHRLIATFRVSCEGLSSVSESEITIPPGKPPGVTRALRLLAIDPKSRQETARDPSAKGHLGLAVEAYIEAVGLDGQTVTGRLSLRRDDGKPLLSIDPNRGAKKPLVSTRQSAVVADQAQMLSHFADYRSLGPERGPHRLILSYSAHCDGLTATIEEEHVLKGRMHDEEG